MTRVKGGAVAKNRRRKVLKNAKGYFGSKHRLYKTAQEQLFHSGAYAYRDRKQNKRNFRKLWITRINAACRMNDISYSKFINGLSKAGVEINRKMLSEVAIDNPKLFASYVTIAKDALAGKNVKSVAEKANKEVAASPKEDTADISKLTVAELREMAEANGIEGATTTEEAQVNEENLNKVIIKPNTYSWRGLTVSNMFKTAYNYNRELDSHMMKNTEWGAVAYLSHSKYGINTEVRINNNSNYLTGYAAVDGTDQSSYPGTSGTDSTKTLPYNTETGYKASTTGNITGIYDMSGGAWEYVAGYMPSSSDASGFTSTELNTYSKYLDLYQDNSTLTSYNNRKLGDATGELGPFYFYTDKDNNKRHRNNWYSDSSVFVASFVPWFLRGGNHDASALAGQFNFDRGTGGVYTSDGFRLVLTSKI